MSVANNWSDKFQIDVDAIYRPPTLKEKPVRRTGRHTPKQFRGLVSYLCKKLKHTDCIKQDCPCICHKNGTDGTRLATVKKQK